jgi:hypothetical protein
MPAVQSHREVSAAPARQCFSQKSDRYQRNVAENGCKLASPAQAPWHVTFRVLPAARSRGMDLETGAATPSPRPHNQAK